MSNMTKDEVREKLGNIDQIRDIIFGAQMREYDARLEQMRSDMNQQQQEQTDRLNFSQELSVSAQEAQYLLPVETRLALDQVTQLSEHDMLGAEQILVTPIA